MIEEPRVQEPLVGLDGNVDQIILKFKMVYIVSIAIILIYLREWLHLGVRPCLMVMKMTVVMMVVILVATRGDRPGSPSLPGSPLAPIKPSGPGSPTSPLVAMFLMIIMTLRQRR